MGHPLERTITLGEAKRISEPLAFNLMIKPAGSMCNLDCNYCYYLDKADIYEGKEPFMSEELLEKVIREYTEANDMQEITFNWHGGEPLLMGTGFYRKAVEFQQKYANGKKIFNTLQTNGTLINDEFASFFHDNGFLIGISIDGPQDIHDRYRKDKGRFPTFARVMNGIEKLHRHSVEFNTLSTVNKMCEGRGLEVYNFLKSIGSRYMQFMPVFEHVKYKKDSQRPYIVPPSTEGARLAGWSVSAQGFGRFLCDIFDYWVRNDVGQYYVNLFDCTLANWCGVPPGTCAYAETCGNNAVIEHNGDVYPCDHFVYPQFRSGNINETHLRDIMSAGPQMSFGLDKRNTLPTKCLKCRYFSLCHGECPKHRFNKTDIGDTGLSALCSGYMKFFEHTEPYMEIMRDLLSRRMSPSHIIPWARNRKP